MKKLLGILVLGLLLFIFNKVIFSQIIIFSVSKWVEREIFVSKVDINYSKREIVFNLIEIRNMDKFYYKNIFEADKIKIQYNFKSMFTNLVKIDYLIFSNSRFFLEFDNQINEMGELKLFKGSHGYDDGEQRRDFIFVDDVIKANLWMMNNSNISGIYNVGTGKSHSFNDIANAVIKRRKTGRIKYIPFPKELEESYQSYTEANLENLRSVGYKKEFITLDEGVSAYLDTIY